MAADITVEGYGLSEHEAVQDALRSAVEHTAGLLIDSRTSVHNQQILQDMVYTKSEGFIRDFQVLKKTVTNSFTTVLMRVAVDTEANSPLFTKLQQYKLIDMNLGDPNIAVVIRDQSHARTSNVGIISSSIISSLREKGFHIVVNMPISNSAANDDYSEPANVSYRQDIQYIIRGQASFEPVGTLGGFKNVQAKLSINITKTDSGEVIGDASFTEGAADLTETSAAAKAYQSLGTQVAEFAANSLTRHSQVTSKRLSLVITNLTSYDALSTLDQLIRSTPGVSLTFIRVYKDGMGVISAHTSGNAHSLANRLAADMSSKITIQEVSYATIYLRAK